MDLIHLELADTLLALGRSHEAADEAREAKAAMPEHRLEPWYEALVAADEGRGEDALDAMEKHAAKGYSDLHEFAATRWLDPIRTLPRYRVLVAKLIFNAGHLRDDEMAALDRAGGIALVPLQQLLAAPESAPGACSLAIVQMREVVSVPPAPRTRVVGELVLPRVEGTGVDVHPEQTTTHISSSSTVWATRSTGNVYWGTSFVTAFGVEDVEVRKQENVARTTYSVVLNPQGLFAIYSYEGLDSGLFQNRVAVVFGCAAGAETLARAQLQQRRAPVIEVVAYSPFDAGDLPVRRAAGEATLAQ
ncbi:MAG: hypothetical protein AMXMBFR34_10010 [Myxococcaceae bacterium]